jgi:hypothetical protein
MYLMDFVVSPPGCVRSVTDFWGWDAHEAQLRCPYEVGGDIWIWSTRKGALNLSSTKLPRPWSPWESSPSRKNPHGRNRNRTGDLMISSQKLWPLVVPCNVVFCSYVTALCYTTSGNREYNSNWCSLIWYTTEWRNAHVTYLGTDHVNAIKTTDNMWLHTKIATSCRREMVLTNTYLSKISGVNFAVTSAWHCTRQL